MVKEQAVEEAVCKKRWQPISMELQYRYLIPVPVNQTSASAWLYTHLMIACQGNKPRPSMTNIAFESK